MGGCLVSYSITKYIDTYCRKTGEGREGGRGEGGRERGEGERRGKKANNFGIKIKIFKPAIILANKLISLKYYYNN